MIVGIWRREPDTFIAGYGVYGPSSPFRRLTNAHEEWPSYIHAYAVQSALTTPSSSRMQCETRP